MIPRQTHVLACLPHPDPRRESSCLPGSEGGSVFQTLMCPYVRMSLLQEGSAAWETSDSPGNGGHKRTQVAWSDQAVELGQLASQAAGKGRAVASLEAPGQEWPDWFWGTCFFSWWEVVEVCAGLLPVAFMGKGDGITVVGPRWAWVLIPASLLLMLRPWATSLTS